MAPRKPQLNLPDTAAFVGGVVGLLAFLLIGLLPSVLYGGYAGVILASAIFGSPISASLLAKGTVIAGIVFGLLATAAVFVVGGAVVGTGLANLSMLGTAANEAEEAPAPLKPGS